MKILHIHESLKVGGLEQLMCNLVNELSIYEEVSLCTFYDLDPSESLNDKLSEKVKRLTLGNNNTSLITRLLNEVRIYQTIKEGQYDIVHIHQHFLFFFFAILMLHKSVKFFYTIHSDANMENGSLGRMFLWLKKMYFRKQWMIPITISPASQESFSKLYRCSSIMIPNGIKTPTLSNQKNIVDEYREQGYDRIFVHAGRISRAKNQLVLCKVFNRLINEGENVVLFIAGPKEYQSVWDEIEPYISERIVYLGSRNDVPDLFAKADAMCLPSIYEGLPITLLEAISVGCISICSPVGGVVNVLKNGENGILAESSDEEDYYHAVKSFLMLSKENILKMKEMAKFTFSQYHINTTANKYLNAYKMVLRNKI